MARVLRVPVVLAVALALAVGGAAGAGNLGAAPAGAAVASRKAAKGKARPLRRRPPKRRRGAPRGPTPAPVPAPTPPAPPPAPAPPAPPPAPAPERWRPASGASWQIQFTGALDTSLDVDVYVLDLFDTPQATIDSLHTAGSRVVCYFSAGSWEDWRPDAGAYPAAALGSSNGWPGERWVDVRSAAVRPILSARMDLAAAKGCDGVDPDNVDGHTNTTGFPLTAADQLAFNRWVAAEAHASDLAVGLKNDVVQAAALVADFDFAVNESCHRYRECGLLDPFRAAGKAVLGIEYGLDPASFCPDARAAGDSFLLKNRSLDAARTAC